MSEEAVRVLEHLKQGGTIESLATWVTQRNARRSYPLPHLRLTYVYAGTKVLITNRAIRELQASGDLPLIPAGTRAVVG